MALAYGDLLAADLDIARVALQARVRRTIICGTFAALSALSGLAWLIAGSWNTPFRYTVLAGLTIGFGAIALVAGVSGGPKIALLQNVRAEWQGDQAALANYLRPRPDDVRQGQS